MATFSFHFDMGNSTRGPVGACARVKARTKVEAAEILNKALPDAVPVALGDDRVEYCEVYFGKATVRHIDQADPE